MGHGNERKFSRDERRRIVKAYTQKGGNLKKARDAVGATEGPILRVLRQEGIELRESGYGGGRCSDCNWREGHTGWCSNR